MCMHETELVEQAARLVMSMPDKKFCDLTVGTLANMMNVERSKLSRQFKRVKEMRLEDFIFKEKMTRAAFLLRIDGRITIKQVSQQVGFLTSDYFSRLFKNYFGILPVKYREFKCLTGFQTANG